MKIAFDENMPASMVRVFEAIGDDPGFRKIFKGTKIVRAKDYAPKVEDADFSPKDDRPWMRRYKDDGGRIVISGDVSMPKKHHELLAIIELGLVAFFFPAEWNEWPLGPKSAFLLAWVERVITQARKSKPSALYRIPKDWRPEASLLHLNAPGPLRLKDYDSPVRNKPKLRRRKREKTERDYPLLDAIGMVPKNGVTPA